MALYFIFYEHSHHYFDDSFLQIFVNFIIIFFFVFINKLINLPNNQVSRLQAILNAAARIIKKPRKFDHVTPLLKELHWLPIVKRPIFKILLLVFKTLRGEGPQYLMDLLVPYVPTVNLRSSTDQLLCVPKSKLVTYGDRAFSVIAPSLWNDLPIEIKDCDTVPIFKRKLKTYLFTQAYS